MFSLQIFTEILIVGLFLILGVSPFLLLVNKEEEAQGQSEFWPLKEDYSGKVKVVIILLLAYALGAGVNRLADDFWGTTFSKLNISTTDKFEKKLHDFVAQAADGQNKQAQINCQGEVADNHDCLNVVEMALRERSEATRDWLDNRRAYIRLLRAAALSALLFILGCAFYKLMRRKSSRYTPSHVVLAGAFLIALTLAHWEADQKYWKRVYELYTAMPPAPPAERCKQC